MAQSGQLTIRSYLAPNLFWFYEAVAAGLANALNTTFQLQQGECDPLEDPMLLEDQVDVAFICGLPFIRHYRETQQLRAIAAPVMQHPRYESRPVYFSDVIVSTNSSFATFEDLANSTLGYNDLGSNSGYNLLRYRLMQGGYPSTFFHHAIPSGSHQQSIRWVADGKVDCAAIDSTVLEQELRTFPELAHHIRVIETIGPCPMPPVAVAEHLNADLIHQMQMALLQPDEALQVAMQQAQIQHYASVDNREYEAIALQYDAALKAGYEQLG